jgi:hypothetical protein
MSNVLQLFRREKIEDPSGPETIAVADIVAANARLVRTIQELSRHLDAVEHVFDKTSDAGTQSQFKRVTKLCREELASAMLELSEKIRQLPALQR